MRVRMIMGWMFATLISLAYSYVVATYMYMRCLGDSNVYSQSPMVVCVGLFFILIGLCMGVARLFRRNKGALKVYLGYIVLAVLMLPLLWLYHDDPPLDDDYSLQDVLTGDPAMQASYGTLFKLRKRPPVEMKSRLTPALCSEILTNSVAYSELIEEQWGRIAEWRSIIETLDSFPGLVDLTPDTQLQSTTPIISYVKLRIIAQTYRAHALLLAEQGNSAEAARILAQLRSVTRKALPHMSILVDKMIWIAVAKMNIESAAAIMRHKNCTREALIILRKHFRPLSENDTSIRRVLITEYLFMKSLCENSLSPGCLSDDFGAANTSVLGRRPVRIIGYPMLRKNRTCRTLRKICDLSIEGSELHPPDMTKVESALDDYISKPDIRNMDGWFLVAIAIPSFTKAAQIAVETRILSELLFVELGWHLCETSDGIQDYYADAPYAKDDVTGYAFSLGPDGIAKSSDDIMIGVE